MFGVYKTGGAIGEPSCYFVFQSEDKEECKEKAKSFRKSLSKGEKEYYRIRFKVKKVR